MKIENCRIIRRVENIFFRVCLCLILRWICLYVWKLSLFFICLSPCPVSGTHKMSVRLFFLLLKKKLWKMRPKSFFHEFICIFDRNFDPISFSVNLENWLTPRIDFFWQFLLFRHIFPYLANFLHYFLSFSHFLTLFFLIFDMFLTHFSQKTSKYSKIYK